LSIAADEGTRPSSARSSRYKMVIVEMRILIFIKNLRPSLGTRWR